MEEQEIAIYDQVKIVKRGWEGMGTVLEISGTGDKKRYFVNLNGYRGTMPYTPEEIIKIK